MRMSIRYFAKANLPYASLAISIVSLVLSGGILLNAERQQERDFAHRELLLRPWLNFEMNNDDSVSNKHQFWVAVRNDGLGPAIVREIIIEADGQCYNSSAAGAEMWAKMYRKQLEKVLEDQAGSFPASTSAANTYGSGELYKVSDAPKKVRRKIGDDLGYTEYQAFDVYGVTTDNSTIGIATLTPDSVISAGSGFTMAQVTTDRTERTTTVPRTEAVATKKPIQKKEPNFSPDTVVRNRQSDPDAVIGLNMGVGYCSISGQTCDFIRFGTSHCFPGT